MGFDLHFFPVAKVVNINVYINITISFSINQLISMNNEQVLKGNKEKVLHTLTKRNSSNLEIPFNHTVL